MAEIIDAHHHLWRYSESEYAWISSEMDVLRQHFLVEDLSREMQGAGVHGAVVVQARQSLEETNWLLACAEENPHIRGVVGWAPLVDGDVTGFLETLSHSAKLKGLRHVMQDEADGFMLGTEFNAGVSSVLKTGLVYDILIRERQLPEAVEFVQRHPGQVFMLDHMAKPKIRACEIEPWRKNLFQLAKTGDVYCKVSGIVTEADWRTWTPQSLRCYLDAALEAFGPSRMIAGSDWPVCLLASGYARWWDALREMLCELPSHDQEAILGGNATRAYRL